MKYLTNQIVAVSLLMAMGLTFLATESQARVVLTAQGSRYQRPPSDHEFVFEGGLAEPMGDQTDDFWVSDNGFGSSTGYQLGIRFRQYLGEFFAVSPAWHYTRFGTASGVTDTYSQSNQAYDIRTSNYRYGLDFQAFMGGGASPIRLFLTGGVALVNNRLRDELQYDGVFKATVNTPSYSAGVGLKMKNIELVGEYTSNRFDTNKFSDDGAPLSYNWDYLVVRVGLSFGR